MAKNLISQGVGYIDGLVVRNLTVTGSASGGVVTGTVDIDPPNITANGGVETIDVTIAGVTANDYVVLIPPATLEAGLCPVGVRAKAGGVDLVLMNATAGAVNGTSRTWTYKIFKAVS